MKAIVTACLLANMSVCKTGSVVRADVTSEKVCAQLIQQKAKEYPRWTVTSFKCVKM